MIEKYFDELRLGLTEKLLCGPLNGGTIPRVNGRIPLVCGSYGCVFPLELANKEMVACKVLVPVVDTEELFNRYTEIKPKVKELARRTKCFSDIEIYREGCEVRGVYLPIVTTPWIEGKQVDEYIEDATEGYSRIKDGAGLLNWKLAKQFHDALKECREMGIAHGDLSFKNMLVSGDVLNPQLHIIDYDSIFVPELAGKEKIIGETASLLTENARGNRYDAEMDREAALLIFIQLCVITMERKKKWSSKVIGFMLREEDSLIEEMGKGTPADRELSKYYSDVLESYGKGDRVKCDVLNMVENCLAVRGMLGRAIGLPPRIGTNIIENEGEAEWGKPSESDIGKEERSNKIMGTFTSQLEKDNERDEINSIGELKPVSAEEKKDEPRRKNRKKTCILILGAIVVIVTTIVVLAIEMSS